MILKTKGLILFPAFNQLLPVKSAVTAQYERMKSTFQIDELKKLAQRKVF